MSFPVLSLLDSFIRVEESPLSNGGKWKALGGTGENVVTGLVREEAWKPKTPFVAGKEDGAYWSVQEFADAAVALELHVLAASAERYVALWCCLSNPTLTKKSGYRMRVQFEAAGKFIFRLEKITESVAATISEVTAVAVAVGDRIGLDCQFGVVTMWHKVGAGAWAVVGEVADTAFTSGFVAVSGAGNLTGSRNFEVAHRHGFTASQGQVVSKASALSRTLQPTQGQSATLIVSHLLELPTIAQGQSATRSGTLTRALPTAQGQSATPARSPTRALSTTQGQSATLSGAHAATLSTSQGATGLVRHDLTRTLSTSQPQVASLTEVVEAGAHEHTLTTVASTTISIARSPARTLTTSGSSTVTLSETITEASLHAWYASGGNSGAYLKTRFFGTPEPEPEEGPEPEPEEAPPGPPVVSKRGGGIVPFSRAL